MLCHGHLNTLSQKVWIRYSQTMANLQLSAVRPPAVAGLFYPADPAELRAAVNAHLCEAQPLGIRPKALIVPHAGYAYSGAVAATAYRQIMDWTSDIHRVAVFGPSHRVHFTGLALPTTAVFRTPLGDVAIDTDTVDRLAALPQVQVLNQAHAREHSLEVQLPFLQVVLDDFTLVPLVVGDVSSADAAAVLNAVWDDEETFIVVSSDLSHYHTYDSARRIDAETLGAIERLDSGF
ncbi:MAG: AmmeMemoRadiSam system protein B, partial [Candidatus Tectomicrobia bacterium]